MMALDSTQFVVRRCSALLLLMMVAAALSWAAPGYADQSSDAPFDLNGVPFHGHRCFPIQVLVSPHQPLFDGGKS